VYAELEPFGLTVITVALDRDLESPRPWIEAAKPTHPSLIDTGYVVADLYNMVNVPTVLWIDEEGRIVRPNDVVFATDMFKGLTGIESAPRLEALRRWVHEGVNAIAADETAEFLSLPSAIDQQARTEFGLARWLLEQDRTEAAERHFVTAGELAPHDFTIRRGSMPMRGIDSMGPAFAEMAMAWRAAGHPYYCPLPK
jgi:hypothetical protein